MTMKNDTMRTEIFALALLNKEDSYGYELTNNINRLSKGYLTVKEGTLYPILHVALKAGYIKSYDIIIDKKIRVYYSLTDSGKKHLVELINNYRSVLDIIYKITDLS